MCKVCLTLRNNTLKSVQFGKCLNSTNIIQGLEIGLNGIFIKLFVIDEIYIPCKMLLIKGLKIYSLLPTNVFFLPDCSFVMIAFQPNYYILLSA